MKKLLKMFFGKSYLQPFYERLLKISLYGMNIGLGSDCHRDGALFVLNLVKSKMNNYKKPLIIFDVGANIGNYTLEVENIFNQKNEIIIFVFEPSKNVFKELTYNVSKFQNVNTYNIGLSDRQAILDCKC